MFQPELSETPSCVTRQFSIISVHAHICVGPSSSPAARGTHGPLDTRETGTITRFVLDIAEFVHVIIGWAESLNLHSDLRGFRNDRDRFSPALHEWDSGD